MSLANGGLSCLWSMLVARFAVDQAKNIVPGFQTRIPKDLPKDVLVSALPLLIRPCPCCADDLDHAATGPLDGNAHCWRYYP